MLHDRMHIHLELRGLPQRRRLVKGLVPGCFW
jgi:hypothetical protein